MLLGWSYCSDILSELEVMEKSDQHTTLRNPVELQPGMFIHAIHNMGLVTLTHTPSPMGFLRDILNRPEHEHAMLVMPVGYPAEDAMVPDIARKSLDEVAIFFE